MLYNNIIKPFIEEVSANPDKTAAKMGGKVVTNSQFTQLVAPIMNEMDALSVDRVCIMMEDELSVFAALMAGVFNNVTVIPVAGTPDSPRTREVCTKLGVSEILTAHRMHYYFRMTFEDALCRIDNGLHQVADEKPVCITVSENETGQLSFKEIFARDLTASRRFSYTVFFSQLLPKHTKLCFTF